MEVRIWISLFLCLIVILAVMNYPEKPKANIIGPGEYKVKTLAPMGMGQIKLVVWDGEYWMELAPRDVWDAREK